MKKTLITLVIVLVFLGVYLYVGNVFAVSEYKKVKEKNCGSDFCGVGLVGNDGSIEIGVGDQVEVSVTRNRWYGKIYEQRSGENDLSMMHLFKIIKIPTRVNGANLMIGHIVTMGIIIFILLAVFIIELISKKENERGYGKDEWVS